MKQLHWKKCLMAVAIAFAGVLGAASFGPTGMTAKAEGSGAEGDPFEIYNAQDLSDFLNGTKGSYGELQANINLDEDTSMGTSQFSRPVNSIVTLDLNGKELLGGGSTVNDSRKSHVINITANCSLTVNDSVGTGSLGRATQITDMQLEGYKPCSIIMVEEDGTLVFNGGTIQNTSSVGIYVQSGNAIINGGTISGASYSIVATAATITGNAVITNPLYSNSSIAISGNAQIKNTLEVGSGTFVLTGGYYSSSTVIASSYLKDETYQIEEGSFIFPSGIYTQHVKLATATAPEFIGHSLILSGTIGLDFYVDIPGGREAYPTSYVSFDGNNHKITGTVNTPSEAVAGSANTYKYTVYVNSLQMAEKITPTFHYTDAVDSDTVVGDPYSVEDYIKEAVKPSSSLTDAEKEIVKALADYGHYAQPYLSAVNGWIYDEDGAAYATMSTCFKNQAYGELNLSTVQSNCESKAVIKAGTDAKIESTRYSMVFDSGLTLKLKFRVVENESIDSITVDGVAVADPETLRVGNDYIVTISNIKATKLRNDITVVVGGITVTVSPMSYVYDMLRLDSVSTDGKNLAGALYYYAKACGFEM